MLKFQLFSRRPGATVDFRPDVDPESPNAQMRRLSVYLNEEVPPPGELTDCNDALDYLREYTYRKIFTGTTHGEYMALDRATPHVIDWLIAVHEAESAAHARTNKKGTDSARNHSTSR